MARIDWDRQIGRRLRLRDLHVFSTVVQCGSMAKAAAELRVSQPSVSEVIANLEHALGARLLDRNPHGVEPTRYGSTLLKRGHIVFDELKQAVREIEFLTDPTVGELQIGCPESISSSLLPQVIQLLAQRYPGVVPSVDAGATDTVLGKLIDRSLDLVVARGGERLADDRVMDQLKIDVLFDDELVVVAGAQSKWARRREIDLTELANERWILSAPGTWNHIVVEEAFRARELELPKIGLSTLSIHLRTNLLSSGHFITVLPRSVLTLYQERFALQILPVRLPTRPWPVTVVTLKNRTLNPVAEHFLACAREVAKLFVPRSRVRKA
jgi:DNA-binding transcriptional LysR family regulator